MLNVDFAEFIKSKENLMIEIKNLVHLIAHYDMYWLTNNENTIPKSLNIIKNISFKNDTLATQLKECITQLNNLKSFESCLLPLYDFMMSAINICEIDQTSKVEFKKIFTKYTRLRTLILDDLSLIETPKNIKKSSIANQFYELGISYSKLNKPYYNKKAIDLFTQAINLINPSTEITAYILRDRAYLYGNEKQYENKKIIDLEQACSLLLRLETSTKDINNFEKALTFLRYGEALMFTNKLQESIKPLLLAACLRPDLATLLIRGNFESYKSLVQSIQNFNLTREDSIEILAYLSKHKWLNYERVNKNHVSLWLLCAQFGQLQLLNFIADHVNKNVKDEYHNNAMHLAAKGNHVHLLPLVSKFCNIIDVNRDGLTPFALSVRSGHISFVVDMLITEGVDPIIKDTPYGSIDFLSFMIKVNKAEVLPHLLNNPNFKEISDTTLSIIGRHFYASNSIETSDKYFKYVAIWQLCRIAIEENKSDLFEALLTFCPEVVTFLFRGISLLQYASLLERTLIVNIILRETEKLDFLDMKQLLDKANLITNSKEIQERYKCHIRKCKNNIMILNERRTTFIHNVVEHFKNEFIPTIKTSNLTNGKNIKKLNNALEAVIKTEYNKVLFKGADYFKMELYKDKLVKHLLEKIKTKEITTHISRRNLANLCNPATKKFNQESLERLLQEQISSLLKIQLTKQNLESSVNSKVDRNRYMSEKLKAFVEHCESEFHKNYSLFVTLSTKEVVRIIDSHMQKVKNGIRKVTKVIPEIYGSKISEAVDGAIDLMDLSNEKKRDREVINMLSLFQGVSAFERAYYIRYTIEQIADKFSDQIHNLTIGTDGVEKLAECTVTRIVDYIISSKNHQIVKQANHFTNAFLSAKSWWTNKEIPHELSQKKSIYDVFLDGLCRIESKFPKEKTPLATVNRTRLDSRWTAECIFQNVGIITASGERYANENTYIDEVGYAKGSKEDAEKRGLSFYDKNKKLWGRGRLWEEPNKYMFLSKPAVNMQALNFEENRISLETFETEGMGDCAFHAVFGNWNPDKRKIICADVISKRQYMATEIRKVTEKSPLFNLINTAIREIVLSAPNKQFAGLSKDSVENESELQKLIIEKKTIVNEYADFIAKPGQSLLPCELLMISFIFDMNIKYYFYNPSKHFHKYEGDFNPEANIKDPKENISVGVCFNGFGHYERVKSVKEEYDNQNKIVIKP